MYRSIYGTSNATSQTNQNTSQAPASIPSYTAAATLSVPSKENLQGSVAIYINAPLASQVQILAQDSSSIVPSVLGQAVLASDGQWVFKWDTTKKENGSYVIIPRITAGSSTYNGAPASVSVSNTGDSQTAPAPSAQDLSLLSKKISDTKNEITETKEGVAKKVAQATSDYIKDISGSLKEGDKTEETKTWLAAKEKELMDLAEAASRAPSATTSVAKLIGSSISSVKTGAENILGEKIATSTADKNLAVRLNEAEESLSKTHELLAERVGAAVTKDSDGDSVYDYDELFIYGTNILAADTDGDSVSDDKEIKNRTSPTSSSTQIIIPEDVQTAGPVAKDLLTVTDIKADKVGADAKGKPEVESIIFRGKSFPNSFVTLFIFSDPIIVTVKANGEGEWEYTFTDTKKLPDGRHNVYTAIVGSAGKILAKSDSVPFVKEAEAVTFGKGITPEKPSVLSSGSVIIIFSLVVAAVIGVLVLIGLSRRNKNSGVKTEPPAVPPLSSSL